MKVCGFTFVRNAKKYDYPVKESILSILPLCDQFIVSVGDSDDGTREVIESISSSKIIIHDTVWDDSLREGGKVLAAETNKAMDAITGNFDWLIYIQADEVLHDDSIKALNVAMHIYKDRREVEGLLLKYLHFYGTYDYVGDSRRWYRNEVRVIRNDKEIRSYKDAQGFRKSGRKLNVKSVNAWMYHYGWVKDPVAQKAKEKSFHKYWHDDEWMKSNIKEEELFDYSRIDSLEKFTGTHPLVMNERIMQRKWQLNFNPEIKKLSLKDALLQWFERKTAIRLFEYKNYRKI